MLLKEEQRFANTQQGQEVRHVGERSCVDRGQRDAKVAITFKEWWEVQSKAVQGCAAVGESSEQACSTDWVQELGCEGLEPVFPHQSAISEHRNDMPSSDLEQIPRQWPGDQGSRAWPEQGKRGRKLVQGESKFLLWLHHVNLGQLSVSVWEHNERNCVHDLEVGLFDFHC